MTIAQRQVKQRGASRSFSVLMSRCQVAVQWKSGGSQFHGTVWTVRDVFSDAIEIRVEGQVALWTSMTGYRIAAIFSIGGYHNSSVTEQGLRAVRLLV